MLVFICFLWDLRFLGYYENRNIGEGYCVWDVIFVFFFYGSLLFFGLLWFGKIGIKCVKILLKW